MNIKISDIYVKGNGHNHKVLKITDHPYYTALKINDPYIYENYVSLSLHQKNKKSGTWKGFLHLFNKIKKYGYNPYKSKIHIVNKENKIICTHGKHRMIILFYLYNNAIIKVKQTFVSNIIL